MYLFSSNVFYFVHPWNTLLNLLGLTEDLRRSSRTKLELVRGENPTSGETLK